MFDVTFRYGQLWKPAGCSFKLIYFTYIISDRGRVPGSTIKTKLLTGLKDRASGSIIEIKPMWAAELHKVQNCLIAGFFTEILP